MGVKKAVCVLVILLSGIWLTAQVRLNGKVTDEKLQPVSGVNIHLLNTSENVVSDKAGNFITGKLPPGKYTIELSAAGFATLATKIQFGEGNNTVQLQLKNTLVQLEPVTVTAEKKESLLQDVPSGISAINSRQAVTLRLWDIKQLTAVVPNLYAGNPGDGRNVVAVRGITTTAYDPAVATYIDGVNQFSLDTYIPQLMDIERVEVLRGPQGTLYGRNAMGGVINIITKQPTNNTTGFAEVNVGNYNLQRYTAGVRTPLIKNKLFFGAAATFNKRDGYYKNDFNNTSFDKVKEFSGNYYLKYLPAQKWAITLNVKHQNNKNDGAFPLVNGVDEAFSNPYKVNQNATAQMNDNTLNASLSANYSGGKINFSSQLAWQTNRRTYNAPLDGDFSPVDAVTIINNYGGKWNKVKVLTHEFRLSSVAAKKSPFSWVAGTYFFHQYNPSKQATHFGADAGLLGVPDSNFATVNTTSASNTGVALYGQATYAITTTLQLTAGLRYDYEYKKTSVQGEYQKDGQPAFTTTPDTSASAHYHAFSPKIGLSYQPSQQHLFFINYSRGFRTGGLTQLSSDPSQPPLYPYKPEYSNNIEAGIKNTLLENKLTANLVFFITHVNNAQVPTLILPDAITVIKNTGQLRSNGAEVELQYKPVKGLQLEYAGGYTNANYKSLKVPGIGQVVNLDGKKQIFTPDITSMLAAQYSYVVSKKRQWQMVARAEWFYLGKQYFDLTNNIQQHSYQLANARVGVGNRHLDIFFWARNIFKQKYIEYAYDFGAVHLGNPVTYGFSLRINY